MPFAILLRQPVPAIRFEQDIELEPQFKSDCETLTACGRMPHRTGTMETIHEAATRSEGGLTPRRNPQQRRSQAAHDRVIAAARRLTSDRDFDSISIRDLAEAGQCSVGNFYYRFGTKEAFFDLLIDDMVERRKVEVRQTLLTNPISRLPEALARGALDNHRAYAGLLRSVIKKHLEGDPKWERVSAMGRYAIAEFRAAVEAHRGRPLSEAQIERVHFAFVWLYGLLAQSLLGLNTIFGMETEFFEDRAVHEFVQAIEHALQD